MTSKEIEEIKARCAAATPGPWTFPYWSRASWYAGSQYVGSCMDETSKQVGYANAKFCAHAREDIPALLAEVEKLNRQNDTLRRAGSSLQEALNQEGAEVERLQKRLDETDGVNRC